MTRVTQLIHDAGKYLLISVYHLPTHPTHNFTHKNDGNLETLPGWPKKLQHNRPARSAGQWDRHDYCIRLVYSGGCSCNHRWPLENNRTFHLAKSLEHKWHKQRVLTPQEYNSPRFRRCGECCAFGIAILLHIHIHIYIVGRQCQKHTTHHPAKYWAVVLLCLTPGNQGWNDLHSLCRIGMEYY